MTEWIDKYLKKNDSDSVQLHPKTEDNTQQAVFSFKACWPDEWFESAPPIGCVRSCHCETDGTVLFLCNRQLTIHFFKTPLHSLQGYKSLWNNSNNCWHLCDNLCPTEWMNRDDLHMKPSTWTFSSNSTNLPLRWVPDTEAEPQRALCLESRDNQSGIHS